jgi:hypothetical protein
MNIELSTNAGDCLCILAQTEVATNSYDSVKARIVNG